MWHASAASGPYRKRPTIDLLNFALEALEGVGDPEQQWREWTGYAYHVRRRLTPEEEKLTGPAIDCRVGPHAGEWTKRYYAAVRELPEAAKRFAQEEIGLVVS